MSVEMPYEITSLECITHQIKIKVIWVLIEKSISRDFVINKIGWFPSASFYCIIKLYVLSFGYGIWDLDLSLGLMIFTKSSVMEAMFVCLLCLKNHNYEWTFPLFYPCLCVIPQRTDCKAVVSVLPGEVMGPDGFQLSVTLSEVHLPRMWVEKHPSNDSQVCLSHDYDSGLYK